MPDRESTPGHSARLLRGLVWAGVLLAPLAAVVVLLGGGAGSVRFAVLVLAVSVVLVGTSVLIRSDPVLLRMDVEDRVAQEVEVLRAELRAEFARTGPPVGGSAVVAAASASVPSSVPQQRGPARPAVYGSPHGHGESGVYGSSNGHGESGVYGSPNGHGESGVYGSPNGQGEASLYGPPDDRYGPPDAHGEAGGVYRPSDDRYGPGDDFDPAYHQPAGHGRSDRSPRRAPDYRPRRHRPSANDTNVGTLADFAAAGGYREPSRGNREPSDAYQDFSGGYGHPHPDDRYSTDHRDPRDAW